MKSFSWIRLSVLLSIVSLAACGGDDDPPPTIDAGNPMDAGGDTDGPMDDTDAAMQLPALSAPASVLWDAAEDVWYVTNTWDEAGTASSVGWITRLDPFGQVQDAHWVEGLESPRGMALVAGDLYVADGTDLVIIDTENGTISNRVQVADEQALEDVAAGGGMVYATEPAGNAIHQMEPGKAPTLFVQDESLKGPNGILVEEERLVVASIGATDDASDVATLSAISLTSKEITQIGTLVGKLDGLVGDGNRYIVSDARGTIHTVLLADGQPTEARDTTAADGLQGAGDIGFDPVRRLVAIPDQESDQVVLVSLELDGPESALWDAANNVWYVSNIGGDDGTAADGEGWITRFDASGNVLDARWVDGLDAPKGMALVDSILYVADIDRIVPIDIDPDGSGSALTPIPVDGAQLLNDMAAGSNGDIYITDTLGNAIYQKPVDQEPSLFLQNATLKGPNGILVEESRLVVASYGALDDDADVAALWTVDLATKDIAQIGTVEGKYDGLALIQEGAYILSDFRGQISFIDATGTGFPFRDTTTAYYLRSVADIGLDPVGKILAIPDLAGDGLVFLDVSSDLPSILRTLGLR